MAEPTDLPAWIALFFGLYALAASVGELARPGGWLRMVEEIEASRGLQFVTGIVVLTIGALVYLASPWRPGDWLAVIVTVIGGGAVVEGLLFLAFGDRFMAFSRRLIGTAVRGWAFVSLAFGIVFIVSALMRL